MRYKNRAIQAALVARGLCYRDLVPVLGIPLNTLNKLMQGTRKWKPGQYEKMQEYLGLKGGPIPDNVEK